MKFWLLMDVKNIDYEKIIILVKIVNKDWKIKLNSLEMKEWNQTNRLNIISFGLKFDNGK